MPISDSHKSSKRSRGIGRSFCRLRTSWTTFSWRMVLDSAINRVLSHNFWKRKSLVNERFPWIPTLSNSLQWLKNKSQPNSKLKLFFIVQIINIFKSVILQSLLFIFFCLLWFFCTRTFLSSCCWIIWLSCGWFWSILEIYRAGWVQYWIYTRLPSGRNKTQNQWLNESDINHNENR